MAIKGRRRRDRREREERTNRKRERKRGENEKRKKETERKKERNRKRKKERKRETTVLTLRNIENDRSDRDMIFGLSIQNFRLYRPQKLVKKGGKERKKEWGSTKSC